MEPCFQSSLLLRSQSSRASPHEPSKYYEAFPFAYPHIRFYFPGIIKLKQNLQTLEPGELAPIRHLRLPVTRLPPLGIVPLAVSRVDNLRLETLTITPPALHKPWKLAGGYPSDLQELLDTITNIRSIIIDNNGYYSDWEFLLLFLRMHTFDQRINLKESFAIKSGLWEYKVQRRRKGGKYGYIVVMRALNYHDSEIVLLT